ncbi:hypothetical protein [Salinispora cortesiana]|uniref:hypothetical protein n=1 Tax=Salinispora cortesiana TaxID=1305843 RepID=UPI0009B728DD|nr:hypothetical protein [Salinispora cortesiana]
MSGYWLIFLILGVIAVVSTVAASLPLPSAPLRLVVLTVHAAISLVLILSINGPMPLLVMVFGPGLVVALARVATTVYRGLGFRRRGAAND